MSIFVSELLRSQARIESCVVSRVERADRLRYLPCWPLRRRLFTYLWYRCVSRMTVLLWSLIKLMAHLFYSAHQSTHFEILSSFFREFYANIIISHTSMFRSFSFLPTLVFFSDLFDWIQCHPLFQRVRLSASLIRFAWGPATASCFHLGHCIHVSQDTFSAWGYW